MGLMLGWERCGSPGLPGCVDSPPLGLEHGLRDLGKGEEPLSTEWRGWTVGPDTSLNLPQFSFFTCDTQVHLLCSPGQVTSPLCASVSAAVRCCLRSCRVLGGLSGRDWRGGKCQSSVGAHAGILPGVCCPHCCRGYSVTPRGKGENRCPRCSRSWEQGWGLEPTRQVQRRSPGKGVKGLSRTSAGGGIAGCSRNDRPAPSQLLFVLGLVSSLKPVTEGGTVRPQVGWTFVAPMKFTCSWDCLEA